MTRVVMLMLVGLAGCADRGPASVSATLGDLAYAVPEGWVMRDDQSLPRPSGRGSETPYNDQSLPRPSGRGSETPYNVSERQSTIVVWTPGLVDNPRKQSITLIRTPPLPAVANAEPARLAAWLADAQRAIPSGTFSPAREVTTRHGLVGARVDGRFTPEGARKSYARTHVAIGDGDTLVHVIYTAGEPDPEVLGIVLDHLAHLARKAG